MHKNVFKQNTQTVNYRGYGKNYWKWSLLPPAQTSSPRSKN